MKVDLRKRRNQKLKKLTKTDEFGNEIIGEPLYVLLEEAEGNVVAEGTEITPDVIGKLNWKDDSGIEFIPLNSNTLPSSKEGITQVVCKSNGEVWCIPPTGLKEAFPLGSSDFDTLLKKNNTNYNLEKTFEFFSINKNANFFAKEMLIGAIPTRQEKNNTYEADGTYIDINNTGTIVMNIKGIKKYEFSETKASMNASGASIGINTKGEIKLEATGTESGIKLKGPFLSISSNNTKIEEADNLTKFNCHSDLQDASYGNHNFRLQFYSDYVRLQDVSDKKNGKKIFQIDKDGTIRINDVIIPVTHPKGFDKRELSATWGNIGKKGTYVTDWKTATGGEIQFREQNGQLYVGIDGCFYQNDGQYEVIDENTVNSYIQSFFENNFGSYLNRNFQSELDRHFENMYKECVTKYFQTELNKYFEDEFKRYFEKYANKTLLYSGCDTAIYYNLSGSSKLYQIEFSSSVNDSKKSILFRGNEIGTDQVKLVDGTDGSYYKIIQNDGDDQYDASIEVLKFNSNGQSDGNQYIRTLYEF
ncbi:MAG: hypothetical protein K2M08_05325 [Anaeroplasmataceae bacterium]|nr:hypothetical protein [Anaeroplasmataceae bacterium]